MLAYIELDLNCPYGQKHERGPHLMKSLDACTEKEVKKIDKEFDGGTDQGRIDHGHDRVNEDKSFVHRVFRKFRPYERRIVTAFFVLFIAWSVASGSLDGNDNDKNHGTEDTTWVLNTNNLNDISNIGSWIDKIVIVNSADDKLITDSASHSRTSATYHNTLFVKPRVKTLEILGRVSWSDLQFLFRRLPKITSLSIDLADNCHEAKNDDSNPRGKSSNQHVRLELDVLELKNGTEKCELFQLLLTSIKQRRLKELLIHNSTFNSVTCNMLESLLHETSESLQEIDVQESCLSDCDFREMYFPQLRNMIVLERQIIVSDEDI